jgi:hypothetical protein
MELIGKAAINIHILFMELFPELKKDNSCRRKFYLNWVGLCTVGMNQRAINPNAAHRDIIEALKIHDSETQTHLHVSEEPNKLSAPQRL